MIPFGTQTLTVKRAPLISEHGNQVRNWATATTHTVTGVSVQPRGGVEDQINRDSVTTSWTVYAPPGADVLDTDRCVVDVLEYDVDGPIRRWESGIIDHLEIDLKAVAG